MRMRDMGLSLVELLVGVTIVLALLALLLVAADEAAYRAELAVCAGCSPADGTNAQTPAPAPAPLQFTARFRRTDDGQAYAIQTKPVQWAPDKTALIICDMWDDHWCKSAAARTAELAAPINALAEHLRQRGVTIIHAPSDVLEYYNDTPARKRAQQAPPAADLPKGIDQWCDRISAEDKGKYPLDQSDGGCDDEPRCKNFRAWTRQIQTLRIDQDRDIISDSGVEIWNVMADRGIENVILVGVHTNMCVLGRPFGLRQLSRGGKDVVLLRDLTDSLYNPRAWPYVDHFAGTDLIVEHIEKFVCPTAGSDQLLGGEPFVFAADRRNKARTESQPQP